MDGLSNERFFREKELTTEATDRDRKTHWLVTKPIFDFVEGSSTEMLIDDTTEMLLNEDSNIKCCVFQMEKCPRTRIFHLHICITTINRCIPTKKILEIAFPDSDIRFCKEIEIVRRFCSKKQDRVVGPFFLGFSNNNEAKIKYSDRWNDYDMGEDIDSGSSGKIRIKLVKKVEVRQTITERISRERKLEKKIESETIKIEVKKKLLPLIEAEKEIKDELKRSKNLLEDAQKREKSEENDNWIIYLEGQIKGLQDVSVEEYMANDNCVSEIKTYKEKGNFQEFSKEEKKESEEELTLRITVREDNEKDKKIEELEEILKLLLKNSEEQREMIKNLSKSSEGQREMIKNLSRSLSDSQKIQRGYEDQVENVTSDLQCVQTRLLKLENKDYPS